MYKIFADNKLIFDNAIDDYKIGKGSISLETSKSGTFTFSLYPDHFFYDSFVKLKTVITVYKSEKIIFRGRCLNDVTDHWNNKVITCEGELGFLQDSVIRPFEFNGTPEDLFAKFVTEHNSQVDEFKRFKIGIVTVEDPNNYVARSNSNYETTFSNLNSRLRESALGGHFFITHGEDGKDEIPTLNYLADFTNVSPQTIEFGSNLKNYTKTVKADDIATAIIPLGAEIDDGDDSTANPKLTIASINNGVDYVYNADAVALYGWIFRVVSWDDVTVASNLKRKAEAYLADVIQQNITIEVNAIDLHLLDRSIESFNLGDYIRVISEPHNFNATMLCNKQTIDLLKPENDTLVLGYTYSTFTENSAKLTSSAANIVRIQATVNNMSSTISRLNNTVASTEQDAKEIRENYRRVDAELGEVSGDVEIIAGVVTDNARNISTNASNIATNAANIATNGTEISYIKPFVLFKIIEENLEEGIEGNVDVIPSAEAQTGECIIAEFKRLKIFYKDDSERLFCSEIFTDGNTSVTTYLNAHAGKTFVSSELTFDNNTFTLGLSVVHNITTSISYSNMTERRLTIYRIEGYKVSETIETEEGDTE